MDTTASSGLSAGSAGNSESDVACCSSPNAGAAGRTSARRRLPVVVEVDSPAATADRAEEPFTLAKAKQ